MTKQKFNLVEFKDDVFVIEDEPNRVSVTRLGLEQLLQIAREFPCKECQGTGYGYEYVGGEDLIHYLPDIKCEICKGSGKEYARYK